MRRSFTLIAALALLFTSTGPTLADVSVEVSFSKKLESYLPRVDRVEQGREALFRRYRDDVDVGRARTQRRFARSYYQDVRWANEALIDEAEEYGVAKLVKALALQDMAYAGLADEDVVVRVRIDRLKVKHHAVAILNGSHTYVAGAVELVNPANGETLRSAEFSTSLVVHPTVDTGYRGEDWAFPDTDPDRRVGPILSYFVKKGLEKLYPGTEFPRPVTIIYSGS